MAGLMSGKGKKKTAKAPAEEAPNVTEDEQRSYNEFVTNGMEMLYDQKALPDILQSIAGDGNPVEGLANALVMMVMRLEDSAAQQGAELNPDVMLHGSTELLEQMADVAEQAGIHKFEQQQIEEALYTALDLYRNMRQQQGQLPTEQLQSDMDEIVRADQAGDIDKLFPGISSMARKG